MLTDYVLNGVPYGSVAQAMADVGFDPAYYQPFLDERGEPRMNIRTGRIITDNRTGQKVVERKAYKVRDLVAKGYPVPNHHLINNATTLTKQAWQELLNRVIKANRTRLRAAADLEASSTVRVRAMEKMTIEYQVMNDPGEVIIGMDPAYPARRDRPLSQLASVPIPFIYGDFDFTQREIGVSNSGAAGMGLQSSMVEALSRRGAEALEGLVIGTVTGPTYGTVTSGPGTHRGTSTVYGYTTFPYRITKTDLTTPTGTNPEAVMTDVLEMIDLMETNSFYGPYILYHSTGYSRYLRDDYFRSGSTSAVRTLRERLMSIEGLSDIRRLDSLTSGFQLLLVQMDNETASMVVGMDLTVLQWDTVGGLRKNFKIMQAKTPLLFAKYNNVAGVVHATTA